MHHDKSLLLSLLHEMQSAVLHRVYREKIGSFRTIRMKDFSFAAVRQFHGDGRDINNISVSIASCYGSNEVELIYTLGTAEPHGIDVML